MSYSIFRNDLNKLIESLRGEQKTLTTVPAAFHLRNELTSIQKRLDELLEELINYSNSRDDSGLSRQLAHFVNLDDRGYGQVDLGELEARARRIDRAIRVYTDAADQSVGIGASEFDFQQSENTTDVFVVHGHDDAILHSVCRVLTALDLNPIVLREQPNKGATIIEKFESTSEVGFAVVLMTGDDMGAALKDYELSKVNPRARQNVIMELGYFLAKLKRHRVVVLKSSSVEVPSDIFGVVYTPLDDHGAWQLQ